MLCALYSVTLDISTYYIRFSCIN